jgi:hypothetical protein
VAETVQFGGEQLAFMATAPEMAGKGGQFWGNSKPGQHTFERVTISKEAQDAAKGQRLWKLSAAAVGLAPDEASI